MKHRIVEHLVDDRQKHAVTRTIGRLKTVHTKNYSGASLSRVPLYAASNVVADAKEVLSKYFLITKKCGVEILHFHIINSPIVSKTVNKMFKNLGGN